MAHFDVRQQSDLQARSYLTRASRRSQSLIDSQQSSAWSGAIRSPGVAAALGAALLFGASTPLAKLLLDGVSPWLLAGLLYAGSGLGLYVYRRTRRSALRIRLNSGEWVWLAGAVLSGGIVAPVLLMIGLTHTTASKASLLLNAEGVFTTLLAWCVFRESVDSRIALGMVSIVTGAVVLSWPGSLQAVSWWSTSAILGACVAWAVDNNLTRKVSLAEPTGIACIKGMVAGSTNLLLACAFTEHLILPSWVRMGAILFVGFLAYGVSLSLFVVGLRHLGTARAGAYFSIAPFFGAALSVVFLGEALTSQLIGAGVLMAIGVWLHLTEHHTHEHTHELLEHEHEHVHDAHHQHAHDSLSFKVSGRHAHTHRHDALTHTHAHYPDAHHRHNH